MDFAILLLNRRQPKHAIKAAINAKFFAGNEVSARTIESYLSRAREQIAELAGKSRDEHRTDALLFYESVIVGPDADLKERMAAQEGLRELLALDIPKIQKHELTGAEGGPVQVEQVTLDERRRRVEELIAQARRQCVQAGVESRG